MIFVIEGVAKKKKKKKQPLLFFPRTVKMWPNPVPKKWTLPIFIWVFDILVGLVRTNCPKNVGNCPLLKMDLGTKNPDI